ncbi:hypothetical protein R84B8_02195 [Treponema sp. R8-4-B8]
MKVIRFCLLSILTILELVNCYSTPDSTTAKQLVQNETQQEKFWRLFEADSDKLITGSDNRVTVESMESAFKPVVITDLSEAASILAKSEPGIPHYFKIQALYKGYVTEPSSIFLQTKIEKNIHNTVHNWIVGYFKGIEGTFPNEVNCIATFYIVEGRFTEPKDNFGIWVRFVRNIEKPLFDPSNFYIANDKRFVTSSDIHLPSAEDNSIFSESVFDPAVYPIFDLFDARIAMDKKNWADDNTYPTSRVKYASEVIFRGQSGTTIVVSTKDNFLTERMTFYGRVNSINAGDKVRVYFTIHKDPIERWEVHALEVIR